MFYQRFEGMTPQEAVWVGCYAIGLGLIAILGRKIYNKWFTFKASALVVAAVGLFFVIMGTALVVSGLSALCR